MTGPLLPLQVLKLKINGLCPNACRFCTFHGRSERLELEDVARVVDAVGASWTGQLLVNGGEPTLHPGFGPIAAHLGARRGRCRVGVGTNLLPFAGGRWRRGRPSRTWRSMLDHFDLVQVGCDDEHHNLEAVEELVPVLRSAGLDVYVNCLQEYATEATVLRLRALVEANGAHLRLSRVTPRGTALADLPPAPGPCRKRRREVLVDCDGAVYFCFHQEFSGPAARLGDLDDDALADLLLSHVPEAPFAACGACPAFEEET